MTGFSMAEAHAVMQLLQDTVAQKMKPYFGALRDDQIMRKSDESLVTVVDRDVEAHLHKELLARYPHSRVIGEESVAQDAGLLSLFSETGMLWVLDPLDGTSGFTRGEKNWGILLSLVSDGVPVAAWIVNAMRDQDLLVLRDGGVFRNGQKIMPYARGQRHETLADMTGTRWDKRNRALQHWHESKQGLFRRFARDVPTAVMLPFAFLDRDIAFFSHYGSQPWDMIPLALFIEETGGRAGWILDGRPYRGASLGEPQAPSLFVRDKDSWDRIYDALFGDADKQALCAIPRAVNHGFRPVAG